MIQNVGNSIINIAMLILFIFENHFWCYFMSLSWGELNIAWFAIWTLSSNCLVNFHCVKANFLSCERCQPLWQKQQHELKQPCQFERQKYCIFFSPVCGGYIYICRRTSYCIGLSCVINDFGLCFVLRMKWPNICYFRYVWFKILAIY